MFLVWHLTIFNLLFLMMLPLPFFILIEYMQQFLFEGRGDICIFNGIFVLFGFVFVVEVKGV